MSHEAVILKTDNEGHSISLIMAYSTDHDGTTNDPKVVH